MNLNDIKWAYHVKLREKLNPYFASGRVKKLNNPNFTILSNNCWGGHVYRYFGLPYQSPTIGVYFFAEDYLRFVKNYTYYLKLPLKFIPLEESVHREALKDRNEINVPIGKLDDIEIIFLHYKTQDEAFEKWTRRVSRINWNNIFIKNSAQNGCTEEMVDEFDNIESSSKLIFVGKKLPGVQSAVLYGKDSGKLDVTDDIIYFNRYINLVKWLNRQI